MLKIIINEGCILLKQHFLVCQYEENLINEMQKKMDGPLFLLLQRIYKDYNIENQNL